MEKENQADSSVELIDIDAICASPYQPRKDSFEEVQLHEMAQTIKQVGLIHPPLVRQLGPNQYELIAGERRYRAAKIAGLKKLPVMIQSSDNQKSALSALIENIQRVNLNPIELAAALKNLSESLSYTQEELSQAVGIKRSSLANHLRLLSLPQKVQSAITEKQLSLGHAKVILSLENPKDQEQLSQMIVGHSLSVREAEERAQTIKSKRPRTKKSSKGGRNIFLMQIQDSLQRKMGTKVEFNGDEKKGTISLHYYSLSDLNRLLGELGYSED